MKVILYSPKIPQNTGNIIRTCDVTGISLALAGDIGFSISSRMLKRASLDYFKRKLERIDDLYSYLENTSSPFYFFSSKAEKNYSEVIFKKDSILIFGSETAGISLNFKKRWPENFLKIPMKEGKRCLNLSNSVSIAIYEALRQQNFQF